MRTIELIDEDGKVCVCVDDVNTKAGFHVSAIAETLMNDDVSRSILTAMTAVVNIELAGLEMDVLSPTEVGKLAALFQEQVEALKEL